MNMKIARPLLLASQCCSWHVSAFTTVHNNLRPLSHLSVLPTVNNVSTDDFMKQLGHASQLLPLLHPQDGDNGDGTQLISDEMLQDILSQQLSHSDGIRGFFAVYLTSPESLTTEDVPTVLAEAVKASDTKVIVPLACMNVIMPTAMSSIHKDEELRECARKTATNGIKILQLLKGDKLVVNNCNAILKVCNGIEDKSDDHLVEVSDA